jgi:peptidylprolyl isomerase
MDFPLSKAIPRKMRRGLLAVAVAGLCATSAISAGGRSTEVPIESDWKDIAPDELMVMVLSNDRRVIVRLAPTYAPEHVANVRALARAHWWDGLSVYRVQDNWVAQWGDMAGRKPLPSGVSPRPAPEYDFPFLPVAQRLGRADAYSTASGISADSWPIATDGNGSWIAHCYGIVGVARSAAPETGSGSELFVTISGAARRLDRNYTVVGRVIEGMHYLSALPRSQAEKGFYGSIAEHTPIAWVRLASDMPKAERPNFQYRAADNSRFAALIAEKENPPPPQVSLGGADVCDIPLAVRPALRR